MKGMRGPIWILILGTMLAIPTWAQECPSGARMSGAEPPNGNARGCQKIDADGNPVKHGPWTEWYMNGVKQLEGEYKDGKQHGLFREWFPNGKPKQEGRYMDGRPSGKWVYWDEQGREKLKKGTVQSGDRGAGMSDFADSLGKGLTK